MAERNQSILNQLVEDAETILNDIESLNGEYLIQRIGEYAHSPKSTALFCLVLGLGASINVERLLPPDFQAGDDGQCFSPRMIPMDGDSMSDVEKHAATLAGQTVAAVLNEDVETAVALIKSAVPNSTEPTELCAEYVDMLVMLYRATCSRNNPTIIVERNEG